MSISVSAQRKAAEGEYFAVRRLRLSLCPRCSEHLIDGFCPSSFCSRADGRAIEESDHAPARSSPSRFRGSGRLKSAVDMERGKESRLADPALASNPRCPACEDVMRIRSGQFGPFWGCSSYPACKATRESPTPPRPSRHTERKTCRLCCSPIRKRREGSKQFYGCKCPRPRMRSG